jgi:hypothetical protein
VQHSDALQLTGVEETNGFDIHQIHLFQIQSYSWITTPDLSFHLINVLNSESPAQPNPHSPLVRNPFDSQRHRVPRSEQAAVRVQPHGHS